MQRIETVFKQKKPFVGYITVGHGGYERSLEMAKAFIDGGADMLEVGVPFSDPTADGPVIQAAMQDALSHDISFDDVLNFARELRKNYPDVPLILFGYYNVFYQAQTENFFKRVKEAGFDAVLVVDLPLEEGEAFYQACCEHDLQQIFLITPATTKNRLQQIIQKASGFLYYVCRKGTTGVRSNLPDDFADNIANIKQLTTIPVIAGFGISSKLMAAEVSQHADGFVIASKIVDQIQQGADYQQIKTAVAALNPTVETIV